MPQVWNCSGDCAVVPRRTCSTTFPPSGYNSTGRSCCRAGLAAVPGVLLNPQDGSAGRKGGHVAVPENLHINAVAVMRTFQGWTGCGGRIAVEGISGSKGGHVAVPQNLPTMAVAVMQTCHGIALLQWLECCCDLRQGWTYRGVPEPPHQGRGRHAGILRTD